jgi:hypothetical protein
MAVGLPFQPWIEFLSYAARRLNSDQHADRAPQPPREARSFVGRPGTAPFANSDAFMDHEDKCTVS